MVHKAKPRKSSAYWLLLLLLYCSSSACSASQQVRLGACPVVSRLLPSDARASQIRNTHVAAAPFHGHHATCWQPWPQGWAPCPPVPQESAVDVKVIGEVDTGVEAGEPTPATPELLPAPDANPDDASDEGLPSLDDPVPAAPAPAPANTEPQNSPTGTVPSADAQDGAADEGEVPEADARTSIGPRIVDGPDDTSAGQTVLQFLLPREEENRSILPTSHVTDIGNARTEREPRKQRPVPAVALTAAGETRVRFAPQRPHALHPTLAQLFQQIAE